MPQSATAKGLPQNAPNRIGSLLNFEKMMNRDPRPFDSRRHYLRTEFRRPKTKVKFQQELGKFWVQERKVTILWDAAT